MGTDGDGEETNQFGRPGVERDPGSCLPGNGADRSSLEGSKVPGGHGAFSCAGVDGRDGRLLQEWFGGKEGC